MTTQYPGKSQHQLLLMGYGALSLWLIVRPERFGRLRLPANKMLGAADRASKELRVMFHAKPLKPWQARRAKSFGEVMSISRRRNEAIESLFCNERLTEV